MEISLIKSQLTLANVLHYYGLKTDKTNRICCPFHEDKTPSLQIYYKTQTAYCFSSNCKTHGKSIDVIDFIMLKENCTKHEAIKKAVEILGNIEPNKKDRYQKGLSREQFLGNMFQYFRNANYKRLAFFLYKKSTVKDWFLLYLASFFLSTVSVQNGKDNDFVTIYSVVDMVWELL